MTESEKIINRRAAQKRWRDKNKSRQRELTMAWQKENKDRVNANYRKLYAANPEKYNAKTKSKRDKNREKFNAWSREWKRKAGEKYKAARVCYEGKRNALKKGTSSHEKQLVTFMENIRVKEKSHCYYCGGLVAGDDVHFDHIVPISKGGSHSPANICVSCPGCNLEKGAKLIGDWQPKGQFVLSV